MKMMSVYSSIEGIGFAIPSVGVKAVVDQLLLQALSQEGLPLE